MVMREARQGELRDRMTSMRWTLRRTGGAAGGFPAAQELITVLTLCGVLCSSFGSTFEHVSESVCSLPLRFVCERRWRIMGGRSAFKDEDQRSVLFLPQ